MIVLRQMTQEEETRFYDRRTAEITPVLEETSGRWVTLAIMTPERAKALMKAADQRVEVTVQCGPAVMEMRSLPICVIY